MTGKRAYDTQRPLTEAEKEFASRKENHDLIYIYCRRNKLPIEEWYDILIIPYLQAVKKYFEVEKLQQYIFSTVLYKDLHRAVGNYYRDMNRKKRMPEGGFISLDAMLSDGDGGYGSSIAEVAVIMNSRKHYVETECMDRMEILDILRFLDVTQKEIFKLRLSGYTHFEVMDRIGIQFISDYEPLLDSMKEIVRKTILAYGC